jgi:quinol monooxygenase YgiN
MFMTILKMKPRRGKQQEMIDILHFVKDQLNWDNRCISCGIYLPCSEGDPILYLDQWCSKEGLCRHIQSTIFRGVLSAMELTCEAPEISFHEIVGAQGLEMVEALRMGKSEGYPAADARLKTK